MSSPTFEKDLSKGLQEMAKSTPAELLAKHRALVLHSVRDPYDMSVEEQETPQAGPGSAVIKVLAAGVLTYGGRVYNGKKPYGHPEPMVPGSNAIGRIVAVGPDATKLKPGQLVFFDCFIAARDSQSTLFLHGLSPGFTPESYAFMARNWLDSTYAEYSKVPLENCFPMDEKKLLGSPQDGGLGYSVNDLLYLATVAISFGGIRDIDIRAGEKVIITPAAGAFGAAAVVAALALGAQIIAMGRDIKTLEKVKALDPDKIRIVQNTGDVERDVAELIRDGPADAFFDVSPGKAIKSTHWTSCIKALRRGGRVSLMGAHFELTLPTMSIVLNDIKVQGKWMYTKDDIREMINLTENGYLKLGDRGCIQTVGVFPLDQYDKAFEAAANMRGPYLQVVIAP